MIEGVLSMGLNMAGDLFQGLGQIEQGTRMKKYGSKIKAIYNSLNSKQKDLRDREKLAKKTAGEIKDEQHKQIKDQHVYNKEEIKRALEINLRGAISQHISLRDNLDKELTDVKSKLAFAFDKKNVEDSSIKADSESRFRSEALEKTQILIENQFQDLREIGHMSSGQDYQNDLQLNAKKEGVNHNFLASINNAELQLQKDLQNLSNFINQGVAQGQDLYNQGLMLKAQGQEKTIGAVAGFGLNVFKKSDMFKNLDSKFSSMFGGRDKGASQTIGMLKELPPLPNFPL